MSLRRKERTWRPQFNSCNKKQGRSLSKFIADELQEVEYSRQCNFGLDYEHEDERMKAFIGDCEKCGAHGGHCCHCCGCDKDVYGRLFGSAQRLHDILVEYYETDPLYHGHIPQISEMLVEARNNYWEFEHNLFVNNLLGRDEMQYILKEVPSVPRPPPHPLPLICSIIRDFEDPSKQQTPRLSFLGSCVFISPTDTEEDSDGWLLVGE